MLNKIYCFIQNVWRRGVSVNMRRKIILKRNAAFPFMGVYFDTFTKNQEFLKYYKSPPPPRNLNIQKTVIFMADEKLSLGGLADRLKGIIFVYKICKELNLNFKINFTYPFELNEYLIPNVYDWKISRNEIIYNKKYSKLCYIKATPGYKTSSYEFWARRFFAENYRQIHVYTNMNIAEDQYSVLFYELFKIHPFLQTQINTNINLIGCVYISVAFRFLQLLGDFKDSCDFLPVLADDEKKDLINKCIEHLKEIYAENNGTKVFVTSDSETFLAEAKKFPFVYVIDGEVRHIDAPGANNDAVLKVFLDFFVLSHSKKVYLVVDGKMYNSGFSQLAALVNNVPFYINKY